MNCNAVMKKLQRAILSTGLVIKISTSQFYSEEQDRFFTVTSGFFYHMMDVSMNRVQSEQKEMVKSEGIGA